MLIVQAGSYLWRNSTSCCSASFTPHHQPFLMLQVLSSHFILQDSGFPNAAAPFSFAFSHMLDTRHQTGFSPAKKITYTPVTMTETVVNST